MIKLDRNRRFLLLFFVFLVVGWATIAAPPVNDHVIVPYTAWLTSGSGVILNAIGEDVQVDGTMISSSDFAVNVANGCNGVEAMLLILAAIGAFPAGPASKISGILAGGLLIQLLNFVRIVTLFLLGRYHESAFELFHTAIWQIAIVLAGVAIFLVWSYRFATPARAEANG